VRPKLITALLTGTISLTISGALAHAEIDNGGPDQSAQAKMSEATATATEVRTNNTESDPVWSAWHKTLDLAVKCRFDLLAQKFFKHSTISAGIAYTVTSDGHIVNAHLIQPSANAIFNTMLLTVVNSMGGDSVLQFPDGSTEKQVEKTSTFNSNAGHWYDNIMAL
jgi:hypothetical protein